MNVIRKVVLLGIVGSSICGATAVNILNASFESSAQAAGGFTFDVGDSWNVIGYDGVWFPAVGVNNGSNFFSAVPGGNQVLFERFTATADASQDLGVALLPNEVYTLTYFVGQRYDVPLSLYAIQIKAGATTLATDSSGAPGSGYVRSAYIDLYDRCQSDRSPSKQQCC